MSVRAERHPYAPDSFPEADFTGIHDKSLGLSRKWLLALSRFHVPLCGSIRSISRMSDLKNYLGSHANYFYADCSPFMLL
jgi:hypothetical protein